MNHQRVDERSLAFGRLIADRIRTDPNRWIARPGGTPPALALLTGTDERAVRLRQSNPFVGALTNLERNAVLQAFADNDPAST